MLQEEGPDIGESEPLPGTLGLQEVDLGAELCNDALNRNTCNVFEIFESQMQFYNPSILAILS